MNRALAFTNLKKLRAEDVSFVAFLDCGHNADLSAVESP
jgi:hypothetical protein